MLACCYQQMMLRKQALERQEAAKKAAQAEQFEGTLKELISMLIKVRESLGGQVAGQTNAANPEIQAARVENFHPIPNPTLATMTALLLVIWAFFFLRGYWNLGK